MWRARPEPPHPPRYKASRANVALGRRMHEGCSGAGAAQRRAAAPACCDKNKRNTRGTPDHAPTPACASPQIAQSLAQPAVSFCARARPSLHQPLVLVRASTAAMPTRGDKDWSRQTAPRLEVK